MENSSYFKSGKITLIVFIAFSVGLIWLVNAYFMGEKVYKQQATDVIMSQSVLIESKAVDAIFSDMNGSLYTQKEWLKKQMTSEKPLSSDTLFSKLTYQVSDDVSILNDQVGLSEPDLGNIVLRGNKDQVDAKVENEINQFRELFQLQTILAKQMPFTMNTIYYSKHQYAAYYPFIQLENKSLDYEAVFTSVNSLIERITTLDQDDPNFDPEVGWDRGSMDEVDANRINYTTTMPVVLDGQIRGILTGTIDETVVREVFVSAPLGATYYLVDSNGIVLLTNNTRVPKLALLEDAFKTTYGDLSYYINKFPTTIETRYEKNETLYIVNMDKQNWQLLYVVKQNHAAKTMRIVLINAILVLFIGLVLFYMAKYATQKKNNLETIIKDSKHDSMTELLNHNNIMDALKRNIRNRRIRRIAVMMVDLDDFKKVNDTFGHGVGDDVIRLCSEIIREVLRDKNAWCGRYGGEEFMTVMSGVELSDAIHYANTIRETFNKRIVEQMGLEVTLSIGVIHKVKPFHLSEQEVVNEADKNLYRAKKTGKNKVVFDGSTDV